VVAVATPAVGVLAEDAGASAPPELQALTAIPSTAAVTAMRVRRLRVGALPHLLRASGTTVQPGKMAGRVIMREQERSCSCR
jgi:hypothetical protein